MEVNNIGLTKEEDKIIMVKKFGETFLGGAGVWYLILPKKYTDIFNMSVDSFVRAYVGAKKVKHQGYIFKTEQGYIELIR